eukprot:1119606-Rhodomonas_salina.2
MSTSNRRQRIWTCRTPLATPHAAAARMYTHPRGLNPARSKVRAVKRPWEHDRAGSEVECDGFV